MFSVQHIWIAGKYIEHEASQHLLFILDLILHNIWIEFPSWNSLNENWSIFGYFSLLHSFILSVIWTYCVTLPCTPHQSKSFEVQIFRIFSEEGIGNFFKVYLLIVCYFPCSSSSHISDCMKWLSCCSKFHELRSVDVHCSFHIFGFTKLHWFGRVVYPFWFLDHRLNRICGIWVNHYSVV